MGWLRWMDQDVQDEAGMGEVVTKMELRGCAQRLEKSHVTGEGQGMVVVAARRIEAAGELDLSFDTEDCGLEGSSSGSCWTCVADVVDAS